MTALSKEAIKWSKGGFFGTGTGRKLPQTTQVGCLGRGVNDAPREII